MIGVGWGMFCLLVYWELQKAWKMVLTNYFLDLRPILFLCGHRILLFRITVSQRQTTEFAPS